MKKNIKRLLYVILLVTVVLLLCHLLGNVFIPYIRSMHGL